MGSGRDQPYYLPPVTLRLANCLLNPGSSNNAEIHSLTQEFVAELETGTSGLANEFASLIFHLLNQQEDSPTKNTQLRERAVVAASISLVRQQIISTVSELLNKAGIQAILLKGAAMDGWIYPDQAFRLGCDIDLLVREKDYVRVDEALSTLAVRLEKYPGQKAFTNFAVEKAFIIDQPMQTSLDVHRNLTIPHVYALDLEALFKRANPHPNYNQLLRLSPEDNLIHFGVHSFYDMRLYSKQTLDAYFLIRYRQPNWKLLFRNAQESRTLLPVTYFLKGVKRTFADIEVPESPARLRHFRYWWMDKLLSDGNTQQTGQGVVYRAKQISSQLLLSGNIKGYSRYNLAYIRAKLCR